MAIDPDHYTKHKIQPIDVIEDWGLDFKRGSMIKYIGRAPYSGKEQDDLIKIANYAFRCATGQWMPQKVIDDALANSNNRSPGRKRAG